MKMRRSTLNLNVRSEWGTGTAQSKTLRALDAVGRAAVAPAPLDLLEAVDHLLLAGDAAARHVQEAHRRLGVHREEQEQVDHLAVGQDAALGCKQTPCTPTRADRPTGPHRQSAQTPPPSSAGSGSGAAPCPAPGAGSLTSLAAAAGDIPAVDSDQGRTVDEH